MSGVRLAADYFSTYEEGIKKNGLKGNIMEIQQTEIQPTTTEQFGPGSLEFM